MYGTQLTALLHSGETKNAARESSTQQAHALKYRSLLVCQGELADGAEEIESERERVIDVTRTE